MSVAINELKGSTDVVINALKAQGITYSHELLEATRTPSDRKKLASLLETDVSVVLELANRADLSRIHGVGGVYSDLLEEAGVDTVKELARRVPENLFAKVIEINTHKQLTHRPPTLEQLSGFIEQARHLPAGLDY
ncbi:DUF4332 domain-containing protein [Spirosoma oryzicola]|uniref:DUF4332 domain-containing protein n=1 Tax=Spirosoma oryzicola TaxID=2898794 RepID=UPI001E2EA737|nr:DUF4332 domain-containing protein [Spirosoma oryzicola]UHG89310.1 DUF4332 domain-containing protein [Spirosoma oryzicola]